MFDTELITSKTGGWEVIKKSLTPTLSLGEGEDDYAGCVLLYSPLSLTLLTFQFALARQRLVE